MSELLRHRKGMRLAGRHAGVALASLLSMLLVSGCMGVDAGSIGTTLVTSSTPQRVTARIINDSCGEEDSDSDSKETGSVKGLSKVIDGFGVPYDEHADNYTTNPTVVTDDSYEANKERGIGYTGIEDHYIEALATGEEHAPDHPEKPNVGAAMFTDLTTEEEQYGCAMRWEYYNPDLSGPAIDGYIDFLRGTHSGGHMQYLAVHALESDKWVIVCPYDWGPALNLPTTGGGKYAGGRIGGLSPAAAEELEITGGDGPENAMTEWWWVENSSQVICGPVDDLSVFEDGGGNSSSRGSDDSGPKVASATVTAALGTVGSSSDSEAVTITPANLASFINMERPEWQHGDLPKNKVKYIVMHDTNAGVSDPASIVTSWFTGHAASHFVVGKDGTIVQCVPINRIAHHAMECGKDDGSNERFGISQERDDLIGVAASTDDAMNAWSIGISLVHDQSDGEYPNAQLNALDRLISYIDSEMGSNPKIINHKEWSGFASDCSDNFPLGNYQGSRNHNNVKTQEDAIIAGQNGGCSDVSMDVKETVITTIADAAVALAGTATPDASIPGGATERPNDPRLADYVDNHDKFYPGDPYYASCDRSAATAVRFSGADNEFPAGPTPDQYAYCSGSEKWEEVGKWRLGDSADMLQPGDVLITMEGHIKIFVGNEAVQKKFPGSTANMYSGSYGQHQPWCYDESNSYDSRVYGIFRCVKPDSMSGGEATTTSGSSFTPRKGRPGSGKSMIGNTASGDVLGLQCAWLAVQMAGTGNKGDGMMSHVRLPEGMLHKDKVSDARLNNCYAIHDATLNTHRGNLAIASCTQTATAVAAAVVDMDMCPYDGGASGGPDGFLWYCENHPDIFKEVTVSSIDELKPGDFLASHGHTAVFVGVDMAQTKFPGTDCNVYEAGYYSRAYGGLSVYTSVNGYRIFRPVKRNTKSEFEDIDWANLVTDWSCDVPTGSGSFGGDDSGPAINVDVQRA